MNLAVGEPAAGGAGLDDVGSVGDPVDDGGEAFVGEGLGPFAERGDGGDRDRGAFVSFGDDPEEQLGGVLVEEVVAAVAGNEAGQSQRNLVTAIGMRLVRARRLDGSARPVERERRQLLREFLQLRRMSSRPNAFRPGRMGRNLPARRRPRPRA